MKVSFSGRKHNRMIFLKFNFLWKAEEDQKNANLRGRGGFSRLILEKKGRIRKN